MNPLRIAFICHEYPPAAHGGIGRGVQVLGRALVERGCEVHVIGLYSIKEAIEEDDGGVQVHRLPLPQPDRGSLRARWRLFKALKAMAADRRIDLIEAPDSQGWCAAWPQLPVPVVMRVHGSNTYFAQEIGREIDRLTAWLERSSARRADYWCSVSRYAAERTQALFGLKPADAVLYPPIEMPDPNRPLTARDPDRVVYTGHVTLKKGVLSLIRAWPEVMRRHPKARLDFLGGIGARVDGEPIDQYLLAQLPLAVRSSVMFHGRVERAKLDEALDTAQVAVYPSYSEAFAATPMEAMAYGCATIYSRRASGPELIRDGENGLLIDPDRPDEIAESIVRLLHDPEWAAQIARSGRETVETRFTAETAVESMHEFYLACVELFSGRRASQTCSSRSSFARSGGLS